MQFGFRSGKCSDHLWLWYVLAMRVDFAFGRTGLIVDLPAGFRYQILEARSARPLANAVRAVETALDSPIGASPLEALARGRGSAAISVLDITRPAPNRLVLPPGLSPLQQDRL